jgi:hypothetical protein
VDRLQAVETQLVPLLGALELPRFAEQHHIGEWRGGWSSSRPQHETKGVEYVANVAALVAANAPVLASVRDELELLEAQLANSAAPEEVVTLLVEPVGATSVEAVIAFVQALPDLGGRLLLETSEGWGWEGATGAVRRRAVVLRGPGVRAQVEPWCGYARTSFDGEDGLPTRTLVRAVPLVGGDGSLESLRALLASHDRTLQAEREVRRAGGADPVDPYPRVVMEDGHFVATGLHADDGLRHLAACLRAGKGQP